MLVFSRAFAAYNYFILDLIDLKFVIPMFIAAGIAGAMAGILLNRYNFDWMQNMLKYLGIAVAILIGVSLFT